MESINLTEPLEEQILTQEDGQNEIGSPDVFYDTEDDMVFTISELKSGSEELEIIPFWEDNQTVSRDNFTSRIRSRQYGKINRDAQKRTQTKMMKFCFHAFDELMESHDIDETFDPMGLTFRDIRYIMLLSYGPDAI